MFNALKLTKMNIKLGAPIMQMLCLSQFLPIISTNDINVAISLIIIHISGVTATTAKYIAAGTETFQQPLQFYFVQNEI